jgi:hypothetical protein
LTNQQVCSLALIFAFFRFFIYITDLNNDILETILSLFSSSSLDATTAIIQNNNDTDDQHNNYYYRHLMLEEEQKEKEGKNCSVRQHFACMTQSLLDKIELVPS